MKTHDRARQIRRLPSCRLRTSADRKVSEMNDKLRDELVYAIGHYLSLHCVIDDSAEADRKAADCIRLGIEQAEYDAVHGRGSAYRKYLRDTAAEVAKWPAWKRGEQGGE